MGRVTWDLSGRKIEWAKLGNNYPNIRLAGMSIPSKAPDISKGVRDIGIRYFLFILGNGVYFRRYRRSHRRDIEYWSKFTID